MVTASHNPAKYNGYKAYGEDGCQMTDNAAQAVYDEITKLDIFSDVKTMDFDEAIEKAASARTRISALFILLSTAPATSSSERF